MVIFNCYPYFPQGHEACKTVNQLLLFPRLLVSPAVLVLLHDGGTWHWNNAEFLILLQWHGWKTTEWGQRLAADAKGVCVCVCEGVWFSCAKCEDLSAAGYMAAAWSDHRGVCVFASCLSDEYMCATEVRVLKMQRHVSAYTHKHTHTHTPR